MGCSKKPSQTLRQQEGGEGEQGLDCEQGSMMVVEEVGFDQQDVDQSCCCCCGIELVEQQIEESFDTFAAKSKASIDDGVMRLYRGCHEQENEERKKSS